LQTFFLPANPFRTGIKPVNFEANDLEFL